MKKILAAFIYLTVLPAMATDDSTSGFISSSPEMNEKLVQELSRADIPHEIDDHGHIWFDQKYQTIVNALSRELTLDLFRPHKETIIPDEGVVALTRPITDMEGALFVTGYESRFGNFVTAVTLELASDKKLSPEDQETVAALLEQLASKYKDQNGSTE